MQLENKINKKLEKSEIKRQKATFINKYQKINFNEK